MGYSVFSAGSLSQVVRAGDSRRFNVDLKNQRDLIIAAASDNALTSAVRLDLFNVTTLKGKPCISYGDYERALVLRSIARHLKRRLRVKMPDRNKAVRGVITSLLDSTPMSVVRCDIESFYEKVYIDRLRDRLLYDTASSTVVRAYFRAYFETHCAGKTHGLPRGTGLSAVLAELAIRSFDDQVRAMPGVYRYFRYADDIVAFVIGDPSAVLDSMSAALPKGMRFNRRKTSICHLTAGPRAEGENERPAKHFEYLGYHFLVEDESGKVRSRRVEVSISPKKINRIKTKMILSFRRFTVDFDSAVLVDRIQFLASNYQVRRTGHTHSRGNDHIKSGIYYNYHLCGIYKINKRLELTRSDSSSRELKALDGMLRSLVKSGNSEFKAHLSHWMAPADRARLLSLSFSQGFAQKMLYRVTPRRVSEIKQVWNNA